MESATMVLEGGATRGVFTSGALDYLMEKDFIPPMIGASAGSCNGVTMFPDNRRTKDCMIHMKKEYSYYYGFAKFIKEKKAFLIWIWYLNVIQKKSSPLTLILILHRRWSVRS